MKQTIIVILGAITLLCLFLISGVSSVYADDPTPTPSPTPTQTPTPEVFLVPYAGSLTSVHTQGSWHGPEEELYVTFETISDAAAKGFVAKLTGTCFNGTDGAVTIAPIIPNGTHVVQKLVGWGVSEMVFEWGDYFSELEELEGYPDERFIGLSQGGSSLFDDQFDYSGNSYRVRVRAEANINLPNCSVTLDGIYMVYYGIKPLPDQPPPNCWDYFQIGQQVGIDAVDAFNNPALPEILWEGERGKAINGIEGGKYYALEVLTPAWMDGDGETWVQSFRGDISTTWSLAGAVEWYELPELPNSCWEPLDLETGRGRLYFYADEHMTDYLHGIRAHNEYGDYFDNLGELNYKLNEAIYNPPPAACEAKYERDDFISTVRVPAWRHDGFPVFGSGLSHPYPIVGTTYVIEISSEPWFDEEGLPKHDVDISIDGGTTWSNIRQINGDCASEAGAGGYRYYFTHNDPTRNYRIRASDGNEPLEYIGNKGYVSFSIYTVKNFIPGGSCSEYFGLDTLLKSGSIPANISEGARMQYNMTVNQWYAIEIKAPPWSNAGVDSKDAHIAGGESGWTTFYPLPDYPAVACAEETDGYYRVFLKAQYAQYFLRAGENTLYFNDNTGSVNYEIWSVTATGIEPPGSCELQYNTNRIVVSLPILYANLSNGLELKLQPGKYMIETMEGPWLNETTPSYLVEMTNGGIAGDYVPITGAGAAPPIECIVPLADGKHFRAYFAVEQGKSYRVRVYDPDLTFATNTGEMVIAIYRVTDINEPAPDPRDYTVNGCNSVCLKPDSLLEIPEWIDYNRCAFSKWISFCPWHAEALASVLLEFNEYEPFGTIMQFVSLPEKLRKEFDAYQWSPSTGGDGAELMNAETSGQPWEFLPALPPSSPFNSGRIEIRRPMTPFSTFCNVEMTKTVGNKLAAPLCFVLNVMNGLGVNKWIQWIFDLTLISVFLLYVYQKWIKEVGN